MIFSIIIEVCALVIKTEDFYNAKFELVGKDAENFQKNDIRELTMEEKLDLEDALKYYEDTCRAD